MSVNPTGPIHVGHARGAVFGSALAEVLAAGGYDVQREYYFNDAGSQMDRFNLSLLARYLQQHGREAQVPEDGYVGEYMVDLAREIAGEVGEKFLDAPEDEAAAGVGALGLRRMTAVARDDMRDLRVVYDNWFTERSLYENGQFDRAMALLDEAGLLVRRDGATWFRSSSLGDDDDKVMVRSNGAPTYFATDIAYHYNKLLERRFDRVVDVLGADHQGHVRFMSTVPTALGVDRDRLDLVVYQIVSIRRGDSAVRFSKRAGEIVTLRELVEEVGADACRFFFLARSPQSQMEFDVELAKKQSDENPVYYVQYAHARIAGILRDGRRARHRPRRRRRLAARSRRRARAGAKDAGAARAGPDDVGAAGAAPPAPLRRRAGHRVPHLLRALPRRLEPARGDGAVEGAAQAGRGGEDGAGAVPVADADVGAGADVGPERQTGSS